MSRTVNVVVQMAIFPASSVAVTVTTWLPISTSVPAGGLWARTILSAPVQLSETVTRANTFGKVAWQLSAAEAAAISNLAGRCVDEVSALTSGAERLEVI